MFATWWNDYFALFLETVSLINNILCQGLALFSWKPEEPCWSCHNHQLPPLHPPPLPPSPLHLPIRDFFVKKVTTKITYTYIQYRSGIYYGFIANTVTTAQNWQSWAYVTTLPRQGDHVFWPTNGGTWAICGPLVPNGNTIVSVLIRY